jgi:hypothetical protein
MTRAAVIVPLVAGADDRARASLAAGPSWASTAEWAEIVAGLSHEPTPGPGDSDGGDVFAPS